MADHVTRVVRESTTSSYLVVSTRLSGGHSLLTDSLYTGHGPPPSRPSAVTDVRNTEKGLGRSQGLWLALHHMLVPSWPWSNPGDPVLIRYARDKSRMLDTSDIDKLYKSS
ncbi:hypothetical protein J6590_035721 [Homalodisca vitripennis]|nr:hypothetical protein J6590_035721 [Homalodisca vitripennis]